MPEPRKPLPAAPSGELTELPKAANAEPIASVRTGPGRFRRALGRALMVGGLAAVFVGATAGIVLISLDLPPVRRIGTRIANSVLGTIFEGKIVVDSIDHLGLAGADVRAADVLAPDGSRIIHANSIRVHINVPHLLCELAAEKETLDLIFPLVQIADADVEVERGKDGRFTLEAAFTPRKVAPPPPNTPPSKGRKPRVSIPRIEVDHGWAHGEVAPPQALDGDVNHVVASLAASEEGVTVDVEQTGVFERKLLPAPISGSGQYHLRVGEEGVHMWSDFEGEVGSVEVIAKADLDGKVFRATADVPRVAPEDLATIVSHAPIDTAIGGHAEVVGTLPDLAVSAELQSPNAPLEPPKLTIDGKISLSSPVRLIADARARDLDPSRLSALAPTMAITADARVLVEAGDTLVVSADARTEPVMLQGQRIPGMLVSAVFDRGVFFGHASADEEGAPVDAAFTFAPLEGLRFDATTVIPSLRAAPRLAGPVDGSARVHVRGLLRGDELDATVDGSASTLQVAGGTKLETATVSGTVRGPLENLAVDARVVGSNMHAGGYEFEHVEGRAHGPLGAIHVGAVLASTVGTTVNAEGSVDPAARGVRDLKVHLTKDGTDVEGSIASITAKGGGVNIDGVRLHGEGVGAISSTLMVKGGDITGTLKGDGVNLEKLASIMGVPYRVRGIADVDIDLQRGSRGRTGHVLVELENGEGPVFSGVSASIDARFQDDQLEAGGFVRLIATGSKSDTPDERCDGEIAKIQLVDGKGLLHGPLLDPKTWTEMTGEGRFLAEQWNLRCLARLFPVGLPISSIRGLATTRLTVSRPAGQRIPSIKNLYFRTNNLQVSGPLIAGKETPAWESRAVDVEMRGGDGTPGRSTAIDGATGRTQAKLTLFDGQLLADASIDVGLDLETLANNPERRLESLRKSDVTLNVKIPRRSFGSLNTLPTFLRDRLPGMAGEIRVDATATGTVDKPLFVLSAAGFDISPAGSDPNSADPWALPVDVQTIATYDGERATMEAHVSRNATEIGSGLGQIDVSFQDLLRQKPGEKIGWTGGFSAKLEGVPLADVPFFSDREIGGYVRGSVTVAHLNNHPTLDVDLELPALKIGSDMIFKQADLTLKIAHRNGVTGDTAIASVNLVGQTGGHMQGRGFAGVVWKDGLLPTVDESAAADCHVRLDKFRLATFLPLMGGALSKLDGHVDGEMRIGWQHLAESDDGNITSDLRVSDGVFDVPTLGEEFRNAGAHLSTNANGTIRVDDIHAEGLTGAIHGSAEARFKGLKFLDAKGSFTIKEGEEIPISFEGVPIGEARGQVDLTIASKGTDVDVDVHIPSAHLELPNSASRRDAQSLDDNPDFVVSHPLGAPQEKTRQAETRIVVNLDLKQVRIEQHGTAGFDMTFASSTSAPLRAELTDKLRMSGDIQFKKGLLDVLGKRFQIEQGVVRMKPEDTGNPFVNVTARWDSPEGTRIYVDYVGDLMPITSSKLTFRSSPPRAPSELIAIVLGGGQEQEGGVGATDPNALGTGPGAGIVGNVATGQLNAILQGFSPLKGISTGVTSTQEGAVRATVSYQLGETVTASAGYQSEAASAALVQSAATGVCISDKPGAACAQGSLEWHFRPNWSVRATVGNVSDQTNSELNLLWQRRY